MAIIKFTCFNTKGTCFLPVLVLQQLLLRFAAVVAAAAAAAYFLSLLHRCTSCFIRVRTRLPRFLPLSFFAANDLGLGLPLLLPPLGKRQGRSAVPRRSLSWGWDSFWFGAQLGDGGGRLLNLLAGDATAVVAICS